MEAIHLSEIVLNEFLQGLGAWLRTPFRVITFLGDEEFFILLLTALYWCVDQALGIKVGIMLLLANGTNAFFKFLFRTPRPYWISDGVSPFHMESSFGLPSGHSQLPASVWGWIAVEVKKRWFTVVALVIIFLIGISRIFLGVHFLTDVLLGWTLGGLLVWAAWALQRKITDWVVGISTGAKIGVIAGSGAFLVTIIVLVRLASAGWQLPAAWAARAGDVDPFSLDGTFTFFGTWFGVLSGYVWLAASRGRFLASDGGWRRIVRFVIGLVGVVVLWMGLGQLFPRDANVVSYALRFVRYALTGLWVAWWAPLMFEKIGLLTFAAGKRNSPGAVGSEDGAPNA